MQKSARCCGLALHRLKKQEKTAAKRRKKAG
jgi:hypothetical protein